jgi:hypothetical protein
MEQELPAQVYEHDCAECVYLGIFKKTYRQYDLYYCMHGGLAKVLARYGNAPDEILSSNDHKIGNHYVLREACERAVARGLVKARKVYNAGEL